MAETQHIEYKQSWRSAKLAHQGRLRYVGPRKGGHWEIMENDDE